MFSLHSSLNTAFALVADPQFWFKRQQDSALKADRDPVFTELHVGNKTASTTDLSGEVGGEMIRLNAAHRSRVIGCTNPFMWEMVG